MTQGILNGFKVVEIAHPHTEFAGCILAGLGATVYFVEPPTGSPLRHRQPHMPDCPDSDRRSVHFLTRNLNKHSVVVDGSVERERKLLKNMIDRADLVLDADASDFHEILLEAAPTNLVTVTDQLGLGSSPVVSFAAGGGLASSGWPDRPPCNAPGCFAIDGASIYAAVMGMMGAIARKRGAPAVAYEVPLEEASVAASTPWTRALMSYEMVAAGQGITTARLGSSGYPFFPAADGYVRVVTATVKQWDAFVQLLGSPDELISAPWTDQAFRAENVDALQLLCAEQTRKQTRAELFHTGQSLGLTISPVNSLDEFQNDPHVIGRKLFVPVHDPEFGCLELMRPPILFADDDLNVAPLPAPKLGSGQSEAEQFAQMPVPPSQPRSDIDADKPLQGVRVLELGVGAVVPESAALLACFGAEVLKIESLVHPDFLRRLGVHGIGDVDGCPTFNQLNLGVKSVALNMKSTAGLEIAHRLAQQCDIVLENNRGGVVERWGLDYEGVVRLKEDVIYLSSQGLGRGAYDNYQTFGPNLQTFSGLTAQWSFPDDPHPVGTTLNHPDHTVGKQGLVPVLAALLQRNDTGKGQHIEAAQVEGAAYLIQSLFVQASVTGERVVPLGNTSLDFAPNGCYPCKEQDRWIAIAVETDAQWQALESLIAQETDTTLSGRLSDAASRLQRKVEIDAWLGRYTALRVGLDIEAKLRSLGVPVSRVLTGDDIATDKALHDNDFYVELDHAHVGRRTYTGVPVLINGRSRAGVSASPMLGEHTAAVLADVLAMDAPTYADLQRQRFVGH